MKSSISTMLFLLLVYFTPFLAVGGWLVLAFKYQFTFQTVVVGAVTIMLIYGLGLGTYIFLIQRKLLVWRITRAALKDTKNSKRSTT